MRLGFFEIKLLIAVIVFSLRLKQVIKPKIFVLIFRLSEHNLLHLCIPLTLRQK